jgi:hypothetical protein
MRRLRFVLVAALVIAGALAAVWLGRAPERPAPVSPPSPIGVASEPAPDLQAAPPGIPPRANAEPSSPPRGDAASREDVELIALEEAALRRIDVVAVVEAAGIDPRELQRRPDADDVLRHLAGDELLARLYMRLQFGLRVYPADQPRAEVIRDARAKAEELVAALSPEQRAKQLANALAYPEGPPPEPRFAAQP